MNTKQQTSSEYFRTLQIIYYTLIAGLVMSCIVALYLNQNGGFYWQTDEVEKPMKKMIYLVALFVFGGSAFGNWMFRKMIGIIKSMETLTEKMSSYRSALISKYALFAGASLFAIVAYYLSGNLLFLALSGLVILVFLTIKPTTARAANELDLNLKDKQAIHNPDRVIA